MISRFFPNAFDITLTHPNCMSGHVRYKPRRIKSIPTDFVEAPLKERVSQGVTAHQRWPAIGHRCRQYFMKQKVSHRAVKGGYATLTNSTDTTLLIIWVNMSKTEHLIKKRTNNINICFAFSPSLYRCLQNTVPGSTLKLVTMRYPGSSRCKLIGLRLGHLDLQRTLPEAQTERFSDEVLYGLLREPMTMCPVISRGWQCWPFPANEGNIGG